MHPIMNSHTYYHCPTPVFSSNPCYFCFFTCGPLTHFTSTLFFLQQFKEPLYDYSNSSSIPISSLKSSFATWSHTEFFTRKPLWGLKFQIPTKNSILLSFCHSLFYNNFCKFCFSADLNWSKGKIRHTLLLLSSCGQQNNVEHITDA